GKRPSTVRADASGTNTGSSVGSLTNSATCGRQRASVAYQGPSRVVSSPGSGTGAPTRPRNRCVPRTTNTPAVCPNRSSPTRCRSTPPAARTPVSTRYQPRRARPRRHVQQVDGQPQMPVTQLDPHAGGPTRVALRDHPTGPNGAGQKRGAVAAATGRSQAGDDLQGSIARQRRSVVGVQDLTRDSPGPSHRSWTARPSPWGRPRHRCAQLPAESGAST